jgi:hypothetical protein
MKMGVALEHVRKAQSKAQNARKESSRSRKYVYQVGILAAILSQAHRSVVSQNDCKARYWRDRVNPTMQYQARGDEKKS